MGHVGLSHLYFPHWRESWREILRDSGVWGEQATFSRTSCGQQQTSCFGSKLRYEPTGTIRMGFVENSTGYHAFSKEAYGFIDSPGLTLPLYLSSLWPLSFLDDCLRDVNCALRRGNANFSHTANHDFTVSGSQPWPRLDSDLWHPLHPRSLPSKGRKAFEEDENPMYCQDFNNLNTRKLDGGLLITTPNLSRPKDRE